MRSLLEVLKANKGQDSCTEWKRIICQPMHIKDAAAKAGITVDEVRAEAQGNLEIEYDLFKSSGLEIVQFRALMKGPTPQPWDRMALRNAYMIYGQLQTTIDGYWPHYRKCQENTAEDQIFTEIDVHAMLRLLSERIRIKNDALERAFKAIDTTPPISP